MIAEKELYYEKNGIIVRKSIPSDVEYLKTRLRKDDCREIFASNKASPEEALDGGIKKSIFCLTIQNGHPIGMFGINPESVLGDKAIIWFLASEDINKISTRFLKNGRKFVDILLEWYPILYNYVDCRNQQSIQWLKFLGAKIYQEQPYGEEQLPFHYFEFRRK